MSWVCGDRIRYTSDKRLFINGELVAKKLIGTEPGTLGSAELYEEQLGEVEHQIRQEMSATARRLTVNGQCLPRTTS